MRRAKVICHIGTLCSLLNSKVLCWIPTAAHSSLFGGENVIGILERIFGSPVKFQQVVGWNLAARSKQLRNVESLVLT